mmetsp:Transcript_41336/g.86586  ORF Transcript_41336/g.86586 Transcript_41336/m.86586 type:complete len:232 (-) Transcript_41336:607-1302(-)
MSKGKQEAFVLVWARFRPQLASCLARIDDAIDPSFSIRYIKAVRRRSTCSRPLERKLPKPNETSRVDSCLPRVHNYARSNAITTYAAMPKGSPPVATPARVAKRSVETAHVMSTPRMSITTCMVVDACAGSMPTASSTSGRPAPRTTEDPTMAKSENESASASAMATLNAMTRTKPAATSTSAMARAMRSSTSMKEAADEGFTSPVASPRMIRTADWFPAFPPAPTSIVKK